MLPAHGSRDREKCAEGVAARINSVLIFGGPGSGKGTQGKLLGARPGFHHFSSGEMFRSLDPNSNVGKKVSRTSSRGELVSDDITIELWKETAKELTSSGRYDPAVDLLLLDGIPRNIVQAELLTPLIEVLKIIQLVCTDTDTLVERLRLRALKENRADDAREEIIRHRWKVYEKETAPVLAFYPSEIIAEVDALQSPEQVFSDILDKLTGLRK